jgi:serine/threonine-protein kinase
MKKALLIPVLLCILAPPVQGQEQTALARKAEAVLKNHCHACHKGEGSEGGNFDVLDRVGLTAVTPGEKPLLVPGKPDDSLIWFRCGVKKTMPPRAAKQRPSDTDLADLKAWIVAGAPPFPTEFGNRSYVSLQDQYEAVLKDLKATAPEDQEYRRYFTLANLHNNPRLPDATLRQARAALSKVLNSLSWKARVVLPQAVDRDQVILRIDLRDYDWDRNNGWGLLMAGYPYGLESPANNPELARVDADLRRLTRCELPLLRADWLVARATQGGLYHDLMGIPSNARELETRLGVDVALNYQRDRLVRAGFLQSGISEQNRLIERHEALHGFYWKSYDFRKKVERGDLLRYPLGPVDVSGQHPEACFQHDGGEIIFSLPNGLQGYMLVDGKDNRIDTGPQDIVGDVQKTAGSSEVTNAVSCMACHARGIVPPPRDRVRQGTVLRGELRRKVERLYPEQERLDALVKEDTERFQEAAGKATLPFLQVGPDQKRTLRELPEPIGETARAYLRQDVTLETAALELGLLDGKELKEAIEKNPVLRQIGLLPLAQGGSLKRSVWEGGAVSLMQRTAREMGLGTPLSPALGN